MFRRFILSCVCFVALPALAQTYSLSSECQEAVRAGESIRNTEIYAPCGFNDKQKALGEWTLWAEKEKAGQALYEICTRHQNDSLCQKAVQLGNGPALLRQANEFYNKSDYMSAANLFTKALTSPLLNSAEKGDIAQKMGLLYLNPDSGYYNPQKGIPLVKRAIDRRGAEANNLMGVYALFGMQSIPQSAEKSFEYFWRAILLGCPAAEENLGLWHLAKQRKIDVKTTLEEMKKRMYSCVSPEYIEPAEIQKHNCDCVEVAERERVAELYPYRLIFISEDHKKITLQDKKGQEIQAEVGTQLDNGMKVNEIRKKAAILTSGQARMPLVLAPVDNCPDLCQQQKDNAKVKSKTIKPYHLSFTSKECSDILYYAERLVDTNQPFTGKTECRFSADMDKTTDLLMNL